MESIFSSRPLFTQPECLSAFAEEIIYIASNQNLPYALHYRYFLEVCIEKLNKQAVKITLH